MHPLYREAMDVMASAFAVLERSIPAPKRVDVQGGYVYRYFEKSVRQALVLKLAGVVSRLNASAVLLEAGYVHEQAVMHRIIDEMNEDIVFLVGAEIFGNTPVHQQFLDAFYAEEFDNPDDIVASRQARNLVPRRKIRAYIARTFEGTQDPHREIEVAETIGNLYSGFVHGAAQFLLDMYGGEPQRYHLDGMRGTPRVGEHHQDAWNYFYRSLLSFRAAAVAFGKQDLADQVEDYTHSFERKSGTTYGSRRKAET